MPVVKIKIWKAFDKSVYEFAYMEMLQQPWSEIRQFNLVTKAYLLLRQKRASSRVLKGGIKIEDPTKPKFRVKAAVALRQYSRYNGTFYKLLDVKRVTSQVVAGMLYNIYFTAVPMHCFNVSNRVERRCQIVQNATVSCAAKMLERLWSGSRKINIDCSKLTKKEISTFGNVTNCCSRDYRLAQKGLAEFMSQKKYVYRITAVHDSEDIVEGIVTRVTFSIAATVCLREEFFGESSSCEFKKPKEEYYCSARIKEGMWLDSRRETEVDCTKKKNKRKTVQRPIPQII